MAGNVSAREFVGRDKVMATLADGSFIVGGDANGLIVINVSGERQRLAPELAPVDTLLHAYYQWLAADCRRSPLGVIDAKWLGTGEQQTIPLPDVYVDLDVIPSAPREAETERGWALRLVRGLGEAGGRVPALAALASEPRSVLVGDAGSGKTTFVNHLSYLLADPDRSGRPAFCPTSCRAGCRARSRASVAAEHIPADARRGDAGMLWQALKRILARALANWPRRCCCRRSSGGCARKADWCCWTAWTKRRRPAAAAIPFAGSSGRNGGHAASQTPDDFGHRPPLRLRRSAVAAGGLHDPALAPFNEEQQALHRALAAGGASGHGVERGDGAQEGPDLQEALVERPIWPTWPPSPLLLTLMATLHSSRGQLPEDRADLYEQSVSLLLSRWQRAREAVGPGGQPVVEPGILQVLETGEGPLRTALNKLADAQERQRQDAEGRDAPADIPVERVLWAFKPLLGKVAPDTLLEYLHHRAGLLIPRREEVYAFPHRSFQEYLAASYLFDQTDFYQRLRS
ncbi:MAG: hypothetical protein R2844_08575 [Caldilineales bacterium]